MWNCSYCAASLHTSRAGHSCNIMGDADITILAFELGEYQKMSPQFEAKANSAMQSMGVGILVELQGVVQPNGWNCCVGWSVKRHAHGSICRDVMVFNKAGCSLILTIHPDNIRPLEWSSQTSLAKDKKWSQAWHLHRCPRME